MYSSMWTKRVSFLRNEETRKNFTDKSNLSNFFVIWRDFSMLKTELYMLSQAMEKSDACCFHLISRQDHPIKPLDDFLSFFAQAKGKNYIEIHHLQ